MSRFFDRAERIAAVAAYGLLAFMIVLYGAREWYTFLHEAKPVDPADFVAATWPHDPPPADEIIVTLAGRQRLTGFLVIADSEAIRHDVPTLHLSELRTALTGRVVDGVGGLEAFTGPISLPPPPFAIFSTANLEAGKSSEMVFVAPPAMIERRSVPAWRAYASPLRGEAGAYVTLIRRAEPIWPR